MSTTECFQGDEKERNIALRDDIEDSGGYTTRRTLKTSINMMESIQAEVAHTIMRENRMMGMYGNVPMEFHLDDDFVKRYSQRQAPFGFNGLGEFVYQRTYSRKKEDGSKEKWYETVRRVVEGTYSMQKEWINAHALGWEERKAQKSAQEMYERMFNMKFLPPGRGLWAMGTNITKKRGLYAALNNCAFVGTADMRSDPGKPFCFLMDMSMLGVGVGFDTLGAGTVMVHESTSIDNGENHAPHSMNVEVIADSREGWVHSVWSLLESYLGPHNVCPVFDYSQIRANGMPIKGFGGVSCGPECLKELHQSIRTCLDAQVGKPISATSIVDIMNLIGKCVVSGNVRRSAEIAFGDPASSEYLDLKDYSANPHRAAYGWASNNSVMATVGMDYTEVCKRLVKNGEPGIAWLENMQDYSRMNGPRDKKDHRARGGNPCLEQTLEPYELCCLVETFPGCHKSLEDYKRTLKHAYMYAKTVTLGKTHWPESNRVLLRNRRIGCSISGIAQFISMRGIDELRRWCEEGYATLRHYDGIYSDWMAIPLSIKITSVKPSGTVSLLTGATPGIHYPISSHYLRRVRVSKDSDLLPALKNSGVRLVPAVGSEKTTMVAEFPVYAGDNIRRASDVPMWEQLALASFMQRHWADNQVSVTVTFDREREGHLIKHALDFFQYQLKGVSFLANDPTQYPQMPYEEITQEHYEELIQKYTPPCFDILHDPPSSNNNITAFKDAVPEMYCDGQSCALDFVGPPSSP